MRAMLALNGFGAGAIIVGAVVTAIVLWVLMAPPHLRSTEVPPAMLRAKNWWLRLTLVPAAAAVLWIALRGPLGLPRTGFFRFLPMLIAVVPILIINTIFLWRSMSIRRAVRVTRGQLCTHCAYSLIGLDARGMCPECGASYDKEVDAPLWLGATALRKSRPAEERAGHQKPGSGP